jgi:hypothetical protein
MFRKLIGAFVGLAMMGMAGTARKKFVAGFAGLLAASLVSLAPMPANAITIIPSTVHGFVRDNAPQSGAGNTLSPTTVEILNFPGSFQDRGVIEFSIATLTSPVGSATLNLTRSITSGLPAPITFDVFGFTGDGVLTLGDYALTTFNLGSVNYFDELTVDFDVTSFINSQIALSDALQFSGILLVGGVLPRVNSLFLDILVIRSQPLLSPKPPNPRPSPSSPRAWPCWASSAGGGVGLCG